MMVRPAGAEGATEERLLEYSKCIFKMITAILSACYPAKQYITSHAEPFYFKVCSGLLLVTYLADLLLLFFTSPWLKFGERFEAPGRLRISLAYLINIFAMLTSASLLLLLNVNYAVLVILLSPIIAIVGIAFYKGAKTDELQENIKSKLKQFFKLSALVTADAVAGMLGTIIGYFKNFREDVDLVPVKFFMTLVFFAAIFGLLSMLLTTVPPSETHLITFLEVLSYASLGLLALAGLAVAAEFVDEFILLAFFHIFLALVVWFMEFIQEDERQDPSALGGENEPDNSTVITISIFAAMMMVYSVYFNSKDYSFHLKTCMFFLSMAFVPSLSWMLLTFVHLRTNISLKRVVKLFIFFTKFWSVLAMLDLIVLAIIDLQIIS